MLQDLHDYPVPHSGANADKGPKMMSITPLFIQLKNAQLFITIEGHYGQNFKYTFGS